MLLHVTNLNWHTYNFLLVLIIFTSKNSFRIPLIIKTVVNNLLNHFKWWVLKLFEISYHYIRWIGCNQNRKFNNVSLTNFKNAFDFNKATDRVLNFKVSGSNTVSQLWLNITWLCFWHQKCLNAFLNCLFFNSTSSNIQNILRSFQFFFFLLLLEIFNFTENFEFQTFNSVFTLRVVTYIV